MSWEDYLDVGESLRWEAKPAPRCYTFRHWKKSLFGLLLVILAVWWQVIGLQMSAVYDLAILALIPIPAWVTGLYLAFGHLILSRLEWDKVGYAVTDRRVIARRGLRRERVREIPLDQVGYFCLEPHGEQLGSVKILSADSHTRMMFCCVEYPRKVTDLLEEAMRISGVICGQEEPLKIDTGREHR